MSERENRFITWNIVATCACLLLMSIGMYLLKDTRDSVRNHVVETNAAFVKMEEKKMDKLEYYNAHESLNDKVDLLLKLHLHNKPEGLEQDINKILRKGH